MKTATVFLATTCCLLAAVYSSSAIVCNVCTPEECAEATNCTAGRVMDPCGCCEVCAIPHGESCHTEEFGLCADGTFCLPDGGLFSGLVTGKCLEITDCFSTGCEIVDDACDCGYSNSCPIKQFTFYDLLSCEASISDNSTTEDVTPCVSYGCEIISDHCQCNYSESCPEKSFTYSTTDECEAGLRAAACDGVECAAQVECPEGSYYEPGPQLPGDCCPSNGVCWCDDDLCPDEPECEEGYESFVVTAANTTEGQCCDSYECRQVQCEFNNKTMEDGETMKVDACTTCRCFEGQVSCSTLSCSVPNCNIHEQLVFPPDQCCPYCQPLPVIDPPQIPLCEIEGEYVDPHNPCLLCTCYEGRTACLEQICEPAECENPVFQSGTCCPVCEDPTSTPSPTTDTTIAPTTETTITPTTETVTTTDRVTKDPSTTHSDSTTSHSTQTYTTEVKTTQTEDKPETHPSTHLPTTEKVTEMATEPTPPIIPSQCTRLLPFIKSPEDSCLTCMCIRGKERCVDQRKSLCGEPRCENPTRVEGECCPVCPPRTTTPGVATTSSVTLITIAIDTDMVESYETEELASLFEREIETVGHSLLDMQTIAFGKTQVELVLAVESIETNDLTEDQIRVLLLERLSAPVRGSDTTTEDSNNVQKTHKTMSDNVVIIVSVASILVALIVLIVFGIFIVSVLISRQNKRRRETVIRKA